MPMHWDGGWHMMGMWLLWLAIAVVVILLIGWLIQMARAPGGGAASGPGAGSGERRLDSAEEILRERYARGEIDREEFDARLRDLHR
jgi:putative membrane protein